jgi:hypothetical protein
MPSISILSGVASLLVAVPLRFVHLCRGVPDHVIERGDPMASLAEPVPPVSRRAARVLRSGRRA